MEEPAHRDGERSGQPPEDRHEGRQRDARAQASDEKAERVEGEEVQVLGDALVGVVGLTRHELHPVVGAIGQPGAEVAVGQPAPPADLQHLVEVELVHGQEDEHGDEPRDPDELREKGRLVLFLQRVEKGVVPLIEEHIDVDHAEREEHDGDQEPPGRPPVLRRPVRADHGPRMGERSAQAGSGRSFWRGGRSDVRRVRTPLIHLRMMIHSEI